MKCFIILEFEKNMYILLSYDLLVPGPITDSKYLQLKAELNINHQNEKYIKIEKLPLNIMI